MTEKKSIVDNYSEAYERLGSISQLLDEAEIHFFISLIPKDNKRYRVLDLGCAEGKLSVLLAKEGHEVTAADISQSYLSRAEELAKNNGLPIRFVKCNIEEGTSSLPKDYFDFIFFLNVVEHVKNPVDSLNNIRSLLAADGKLFLNTPNMLTTVNFKNAFIDCLKKEYDKPTRPQCFHLSGYDYRTLEMMLSLIGLRTKLIVDKRSIYKEKAKIMKFGLIKRIREMFPQMFPMFSSDILIECTRSEPYDIVELIDSWEKENTR